MTGYRKLCTEFYDIDKPTPPQDAFDFYLRYATECKGSVLEPMCGSGRFLIPLLERGIDIEGVDASPQMLQACRDHCSRRRIKPVLYEHSIENMALSRQYNLVLIPASSFSLLINHKSIEESLRRIYAVMKPNAKFVLEVEKYRKRKSTSSSDGGGRWVVRPDGAKILLTWFSRRSDDDRVMQSIMRYELVKNGQLIETEFEDFNLRYYEVAEFTQLLKAVGYQDIRALKPYTFSAADETDGSVVFECSKP